MKAIVCTKYGPPEVLRIKEVDKPTPNDNELLIRIHASPINATDPILRKGEPFISRFFMGFTKPKNSIPGDTIAGEVEMVGKKVSQYKPGDQIYGSTGDKLGAHADYICLSENAALGIKPTNMTSDEAAAIVDGALAALPFLREKAKIQKGQKVLINGASGSMGSVAVQLAKYYGTEVTGVCSSSNLDLVKSLGADKVIDYTKEDFSKNGETYDIIFDTVAKSSFARCKSALKVGGVYLTTVPSPSVLFQILWSSIFGRKKAMFMATGLRPMSEKAKDLNFLKELIESGKIKSVIDRRYTLEDIADAHRYVENGHKKGSVILIINKNNNTKNR